MALKTMPASDNDVYFKLKVFSLKPTKIHI